MFSVNISLKYASSGRSRQTHERKMIYFFIRPWEGLKTRGMGEISPGTIEKGYRVRAWDTAEPPVLTHDTIQRVMASIKPETFKKLLETWQKMLNNNKGEKLKQILAIDGSATALPRPCGVTGTRTRTRCTRTKGPQYPRGRRKAGCVSGRNRRIARGKKSR
jgi:hypothetical protein